LGSLQSLALAIFITAKDDRAGRRIQIQSNDIPEYGLEPGIVGKFESTGAMGFKVVGRPDPLHHRMAKTAMPSHGPATPPPVSLGGTHHFVEHCLNSVDQQCLGSALPGRLLEGGKSQIRNPLTPQPYGHMTGAQLSNYLLVVFAICCKQSDAGPAHQFLWSIRGLDTALKFGPLISRNFKWKLWTGHVRTMARVAVVKTDLNETLH
jgi:hypothetical protein